MIGLGIATKIIRSGKMNRKKSLKIYAFLLFTFNAMIAVILFIFSKNMGKIGLAWASIVFSSLVLILNDCFANSIVIMYNLETTIAPNYSLLIISKSAAEFAY